MAIREVAQELYKVTQKIEALKKQIEKADIKEKIRLEKELKELEREKADLQKRLNSMKQKPLPI